MSAPSGVPVHEHAEGRPPTGAPQPAGGGKRFDGVRDRLYWLRVRAAAAEPALLLFVLVRATGLAAMIALNGDKVAATAHHLSHGWDAAWYLDVAEHGYDHAIRPPGTDGRKAASTNLAFFPVFPLLIRAVHTVLPFVRWGGAGLLTASACALLAAAGIYAVAEHRYGTRVATLAVLLWGILPAAAVETAGYSESAFTALCAWSLYAVLRRAWLTAGVLAALSGLTRPTGIAVAAAVIAAAAVELWSRWRPEQRPLGAAMDTGAWPDRRAWLPQPPPERRAAVWRPVAAAVLAPLGWLGFVGWTALRLHEWNAYFRIQALWKSHFDFGHSTAADYKHLFTEATPVHFFEPVVGFFLVAAVLLWVVSVTQRQPLPLLVFTAAMLFISLGDAAYFSSRSRFLLPAFALLLPAANSLARVRNRAALTAVLGTVTVLSAMYGAYVLIFSTNSP